MTTTRDPLAGTKRLLVDGTNVLHALGRSSAAPPAAVVGRLRAVIPPSITIELVLDGAVEPGMRGVRVVSGLTVRHSGRRSADDLLLAIVDEVRAATGPAATAGLLVITDDAALRQAVRRRGARTARVDWLRARLERTTLAAPSTGNRRPPPGPLNASADSDEVEPRRWTPGRGATTKRGNPHRRRPSSGRMRP